MMEQMEIIQRLVAQIEAQTKYSMMSQWNGNHKDGLELKVKQELDNHLCHSNSFGETSIIRKGQVVVIDLTVLERVPN